MGLESLYVPKWKNKNKGKYIVAVVSHDELLNAV